VTVSDALWSLADQEYTTKLRPGTAGPTSQQRTSLTLDMGDNSLTLQSLAATVAEQSQLIKNLSEKAKAQEAAETRIKRAMAMKLAEQEEKRNLEVQYDKLRQAAKDDKHKNALAQSDKDQ
jgi:predicted nuclease with TOPRIM domain